MMVELQQKQYPIFFAGILPFLLVVILFSCHVNVQAQGPAGCTSITTELSCNMSTSNCTWNGTACFSSSSEGGGTNSTSSVGSPTEGTGMSVGTLITIIIVIVILFTLVMFAAWSIFMRVITVMKDHLWMGPVKKLKSSVALFVTIIGLYFFVGLIVLVSVLSRHWKGDIQVTPDITSVLIKDCYVEFSCANEWRSDSLSASVKLSDSGARITIDGSLSTHCSMRLCLQNRTDENATLTVYLIRSVFNTRGLYINDSDASGGAISAFPLEIYTNPVDTASASKVLIDIRGRMEYVLVNLTNGIVMVLKIDATLLEINLDFGPLIIAMKSFTLYTQGFIDYGRYCIADPNKELSGLQFAEDTTGCDTTGYGSGIRCKYQLNLTNTTKTMVSPGSPGPPPVAPVYTVAGLDTSASYTNITFNASSLQVNTKKPEDKETVAEPHIVGPTASDDPIMSPSVMNALNASSTWAPDTVYDFVQAIEVMTPSVGVLYLHAKRQTTMEIGPEVLTYLTAYALRPNYRRLTTPLSHYYCTPNDIAPMLREPSSVLNVHFDDLDSYEEWTRSELFIMQNTQYPPAMQLVVAESIWEQAGSFGLVAFNSPHSEYHSVRSEGVPINWKYYRFGRSEDGTVIITDLTASTLTSLLVALPLIIGCLGAVGGFIVVYHFFSEAIINKLLLFEERLALRTESGFAGYCGYHYFLSGFWVCSWISFQVCRTLHHVVVGTSMRTTLNWFIDLHFRKLTDIEAVFPQLESQRKKVAKETEGATKHTEQGEEEISTSVKKNEGGRVSPEKLKARIEQDSDSDEDEHAMEKAVKEKVDALKPRLHCPRSIQDYVPPDELPIAVAELHRQPHCFTQILPLIRRYSLSRLFPHADPLTLRVFVEEFTKYGAVHLQYNVTRVMGIKPRNILAKFEAIPPFALKHQEFHTYFNHTGFSTDFLYLNDILLFCSLYGGEEVSEELLKEKLLNWGYTIETVPAEVVSEVFYYNRQLLTLHRLYLRTGEIENMLGGFPSYGQVAFPARKSYLFAMELLQLLISTIIMLLPLFLIYYAVVYPLGAEHARYSSRTGITMSPHPMEALAFASPMHWARFYLFIAALVYTCIILIEPILVACTYRHLYVSEKCKKSWWKHPMAILVVLRGICTFLIMVFLVTLALLIGVYFVNVAIWWILGAIIAPNRMLVFASAVGAMFFTVYKTYTDLDTLKKTAMDKLQEAILTQVLIIVKKSPVGDVFGNGNDGETSLEALVGTGENNLAAGPSINLNAGTLIDLVTGDEEAKVKVVDAICQSISIPSELVKLGIAVAQKDPKVLKRTIPELLALVQVPSQFNDVTIQFALTALKIPSTAKELSNALYKLLPASMHDYGTVIDPLLSGFLQACWFSDAATGDAQAVKTKLQDALLKVVMEQLQSLFKVPMKLQAKVSQALTLASNTSQMEVKQLFKVGIDVIQAYQEMSKRAANAKAIASEAASTTTTTTATVDATNKSISSFSAAIWSSCAQELLKLAAGVRPNSAATSLSSVLDVICGSCQQYGFAPDELKTVIGAFAPLLPKSTYEFPSVLDNDDEEEITSPEQAQKEVANELQSFTSSLFKIVRCVNEVLALSASIKAEQKATLKELFSFVVLEFDESVPKKIKDALLRAIPGGNAETTIKTPQLMQKVYKEAYQMYEERDYGTRVSKANGTISAWLAYHWMAMDAFLKDDYDALRKIPKFEPKALAIQLKISEELLPSVVTTMERLQQIIKVELCEGDIAPSRKIQFLSNVCNAFFGFHTILPANFMELYQQEINSVKILQPNISLEGRFPEAIAAMTASQELVIVVTNLSKEISNKVFDSNVLQHLEWIQTLGTNSPELKPGSDAMNQICDFVRETTTMLTELEPQTFFDETGNGGKMSTHTKRPKCFTSADDLMTAQGIQSLMPSFVDAYAINPAVQNCAPRGTGKGKTDKKGFNAVSPFANLVQCRDDVSWFEDMLGVNLVDAVAASQDEKNLYFVFSRFIKEAGRNPSCKANPLSQGVHELLKKLGISSLNIEQGRKTFQVLTQLSAGKATGASMTDSPQTGAASSMSQQCMALKDMYLENRSQRKDSLYALLCLPAVNNSPSISIQGKKKQTKFRYNPYCHFEYLVHFPRLLALLEAWVKDASGRMISQSIVENEKKLEAHIQIRRQILRATNQKTEEVIRALFAFIDYTMPNCCGRVLNQLKEGKSYNSLLEYYEDMYAKKERDTEEKEMEELEKKWDEEEKAEAEGIVMEDTPDPRTPSPGTLARREYEQLVKKRTVARDILRQLLSNDLLQAVLEKRGGGDRRESEGEGSSATKKKSVKKKKKNNKSKKFGFPFLKEDSKDYGIMPPLESLIPDASKLTLGDAFKNASPFALLLAENFIGKKKQQMKQTSAGAGSSELTPIQVFAIVHGIPELYPQTSVLSRAFYGICSYVCRGEEAHPNVIKSISTALPTQQQLVAQGVLSILTGVRAYEGLQSVISILLPTLSERGDFDVSWFGGFHNFWRLCNPETRFAWGSTASFWMQAQGTRQNHNVAFESRAVEWLAAIECAVHGKRSQFLYHLWCASKRPVMPEIVTFVAPHLKALGMEVELSQQILNLVPKSIQKNLLSVIPQAQQEKLKKKTAKAATGEISLEQLAKKASEKLSEEPQTVAEKQKSAEQPAEKVSEEPQAVVEEQKPEEQPSEKASEKQSEAPQAVVGKQKAEDDQEECEEEEEDDDGKEELPDSPLEESEHFFIRAVDDVLQMSFDLMSHRFGPAVDTFMKLPLSPRYVIVIRLVMFIVRLNLDGGAVSDGKACLETLKSLLWAVKSNQELEVKAIETMGKSADSFIATLPKEMQLEIQEEKKVALLFVNLQINMLCDPSLNPEKLCSTMTMNDLSRRVSSEVKAEMNQVKKLGLTYPELKEKFVRFAVRTVLAKVDGNAYESMMKSSNGAKFQAVQELFATAIRCFESVTNLPSEEQLILSIGQWLKGLAQPEMIAILKGLFEEQNKSKKVGGFSLPSASSVGGSSASAAVQEQMKFLLDFLEKINSKREVVEAFLDSARAIASKVNGGSKTELVSLLMTFIGDFIAVLSEEGQKSGFIPSVEEDTTGSIATMANSSKIKTLQDIIQFLSNPTVDSCTALLPAICQETGASVETQRKVDSFMKILSTLQSLQSVTESGDAGDAAAEAIKQSASAMMDIVRQQIFKEFDVDCSGYISFDEYFNALRRLHLPVHESEERMKFDGLVADSAKGCTPEEFKWLLDDLLDRYRKMLLSWFSDGSNFTASITGLMPGACGAFSFIDDPSKIATLLKKIEEMVTAFFEISGM